MPSQRTVTDDAVQGASHGRSHARASRHSESLCDAVSPNGLPVIHGHHLVLLVVFFPLILLLTPSPGSRAETEGDTTPSELLAQPRQTE